jgi:hypothetical protein
MFQIVRLTLDHNDDIIARRPLRPVFELRDDALIMARHEASGLWGDYGYDLKRHCWWGSDDRGWQYRFVVEEATAGDIAA